MTITIMNFVIVQQSMNAGLPFGFSLNTWAITCPTKCQTYSFSRRQHYNLNYFTLDSNCTLFNLIRQLVWCSSFWHCCWCCCFCSYFAIYMHIRVFKFSKNYMTISFLYIVLIVKWIVEYGTWWVLFKKFDDCHFWS